MLVLGLKVVRSEAGVYVFRVPSANRIKDRWNVAENFFIGIRFRRWLKLIQQNGVEPCYWHRAAFITLASVFNSVTARAENLVYSRRIERSEMTKPPVFILGHWRSGTTLLHNILSQDTKNFCFPNTYQVLNPSTFLLSEGLLSPIFDFLSAPTRPMDNVKMGMKMPQEDEFAPMLETLYSVYLAMAFPSRNDHYQRYLSFDDAEMDEREAWKDSFLQFSKKLTFKQGADRSLLYKTPSHTARIKILLEIFPDAKFVHISRDPYRVIQSSRHFFDKAVWKFYLQRPDLEKLDDQIIERYNAVYHSYFSHRELIASGNLVELKFEEFELDPMRHIDRIYSQLDLPDYAAVKTSLQSYVESLEGYQKNAFKAIDPELKHKIKERCSTHFEALGYPT